jgi:hypothetical protein
LPWYIKDLLKEDVGNWLAAGRCADVADGNVVSASLRTKTLGVMLEIGRNMAQCKSEDPHLTEWKRRKALKNRKVRF